MQRQADTYNAKCPHTDLETYTHTVTTSCQLLTVGQGEGSLKSTVSLLLGLERIREDGVTNTLQGREGEEGMVEEDK